MALHCQNAPQRINFFFLFSGSDTPVDTAEQSSLATAVSGSTTKGNDIVPTVRRSVPFGHFVLSSSLVSRGNCGRQ